MEIWQLKQMQGLPIEVKIEKTKQRIKEWYEYWDGQVYVSFSGGRDSTVLLHLVRSIYPEVPAVFVDTGLEFPEIKAFVKTIENVAWLKPKMNFRKVIEKYGYPVISKEQSHYIELIRNTKHDSVVRQYRDGVKQDGTTTKYKLSKKWIPLLESNIKISSKCCYYMKKEVAHRYGKETGKKPYVGTMAAESMLRTQKWLQHGCNSFTGGNPVSNPISFWGESDIWEYINLKGISYCDIYNKGYTRTGCMFCMYGCHLEKDPNRFQRMKETHPQIYNYCIKDWDEGGLGLAKVLDFIKVPY